MGIGRGDDHGVFGVLEHHFVQAAAFFCLLALADFIFQLAVGLLQVGGALVHHVFQLLLLGFTAGQQRLLAQQQGAKAPQCIKHRAKQGIAWRGFYAGIAVAQCHQQRFGALQLAANAVHAPAYQCQRGQQQAQQNVLHALASVQGVLQAGLEVPDGQFALLACQLAQFFHVMGYLAADDQGLFFCGLGFAG
jgi:hypothetical protein